ncbi:response regulator receiver modulated serine phosphatase [Candidatus Moduliflexus flocculans]|uniref:Response regulator receiver modulated serine phosphatase n=1 Tax=Candidatus Moduliflexus flocculans TaxID=1499966 RepID=A0A0S6VRV6_9BACT|nr:response regulator receiver modulated serine phosphatase [Candidatus Moduliflexus flocculans]
MTGFLENDTFLKWLLSSYRTNPKRFFSFLTISRSLLTTTNALKGFAPTITADRLLVYGSDARLLVAYYRQEQQDHVGAYLRTDEGRDTYLALDDFARLMRELAGNEPLPEVPLPENLPESYPSPIPATTTISFFSENHQLGLRVTAPIVLNKQMLGVFLCDVFFKQAHVARYVALSKTDINFFADNQLSIGTLPTQQMFPAELLAKFETCQDLFSGVRPLRPATITIDRQPYYQGQCALTDGSRRIGAIMVNLSQMTEQREIRKILLAVLAVAGIIGSFAVFLSQVFSRRIVQAFQELNAAIARVACGDLPQPLTRVYPGEFNQTKDNLNLLIAAANETTRIVEAIAAGQLSLDVRERSAHDRLMQAIKRMIRHLNEILSETDNLLHAIYNGQLEARGNVELFAGGWREMITGMNNVIDTYIEMSSLNARLKEDNLRMGAELEVSRRIQQMLLPSPEELVNIDGLEIVGFMQPADEVGGDYYDVLHNQGMLHIGIGDVTGHGLESGIVMLMTQTAIRTLVNRGETDPVIFLNTINRVIFQNIQRMGVERSLTLTMVNYKTGHLRVIGQHEEVLVVRADGRIERIDTVDLGFPLGMVEDIRQWVAEAPITLSSGDGLVLYTDGITEAQNAANNLYGLERLCAIISMIWRDSTAEAVKEAIIQDVRAFIGGALIYDDVTLVVLKQK